MAKKYWYLGVFALLSLMLFVPAALADAPVDGRAGRAELRFLEGMMDHHQMALDMANDCLANATDAALITVCENVITAQTAEITQMHDWLLAWYNVEYMPMAMMPVDNGMGGMDHGGMIMPNSDPVMMMGMMAGLNRLEGVEYDVAWLESMVDHHDDALHMSERLLTRVSADAGHAELLALAEKIIVDQTAEIEAMEELIASLSA